MRDCVCVCVRDTHTHTHTLEPVGVGHSLEAELRCPTAMGSGESRGGGWACSLPPTPGDLKGPPTPQGPSECVCDGGTGREIVCK